MVVVATAADGTGLTDKSMSYIPIAPVKSVKIGDFDYYDRFRNWPKAYLYGVQDLHGINEEDEIPGGALYIYGLDANKQISMAQYIVESSNPEIVNGRIEIEDDGAWVYITAGIKTGTAKLTVKAMDGSGKKAVITIIVRK